MHAEFCKDHLARAAGRMAYLETRLSLTPAQQPLFATWRDAVLQGSQARAEACAHAGRPDEQPDLLTRRAREEERLKQRLAAMDAQTPALTALYQSLSPEQKRVLDHAGRRLHHRHDGVGRRGGDGDGARESDGHRF
jgi:hypothetical protein